MAIPGKGKTFGSCAKEGEAGQSTLPKGGPQDAESSSQQPLGHTSSTARKDGRFFSAASSAMKSTEPAAIGMSKASSFIRPSEVELSKFRTEPAAVMTTTSASRKRRSLSPESQRNSGGVGSNGP